MNKKILTTLALIMCAVLLTVGTTLAWLTDQSNKIENTFTVGDIEIELEESDNLDLKIVPGKEITKDPQVTVLANSENCYLFVKLEKVNNFDAYMTFEMAEGWTALDGVDGVYYRLVDLSENDQTFDVIKDNTIIVYSELTKTELAVANTRNPQLNVQAFAVQELGSANASEAWAKLSN